jgi:undecaprenyl diphosphate synthase
MKLFETNIDEQLKEALKEKIRIVHIGRKDRISEKLKEKIINAENKTKQFTEFTLVIALDYGGKDEYTCVQKITHKWDDDYRKRILSLIRYKTSFLLSPCQFR